jgi:hypothetical protein
MENARLTSDARTSRLRDRACRAHLRLLKIAKRYLACDFTVAEVRLWLTLFRREEGRLQVKAVTLIGY